MDNVDYLPLWKKDATPEERLLELALIARKYPDRFRAFVVIYQETVNDHPKQKPTFETHYHTYGVDTRGAIGLIELGKLQILRFTHDF